MVNYAEEVKRLDEFKPEEQSDFWKPKAGQYKVKALTELEDADPYKEEGKADKPQVKVDLLVEDKKVTWTMSIGKSPASSYGQMCKLAVSRNGSLKEQEFTIVVTNDGKKNTYTIVQ
jgi:hypothetical protein